MLTMTFVGEHEMVLVRGDRERVRFDRVDYRGEAGWKGVVQLEKRKPVEVEREGDVERRKVSAHCTAH